MTLAKQLVLDTQEKLSRILRDGETNISTPLILVWKQCGYADEGGGVQYDIYPNIESVATHLFMMRKNRNIDVIYCGYLKDNLLN